MMCLPLRNRGKVLGVLYADNSLSEAQFSRDYIPILTTFANQAATAIVNAQLYESSRREAQLERELQIGQENPGGLLCPRNCRRFRDGRLPTYFYPARNVAGDYYDVFSWVRGKMGFCRR